MTTLTPNEFHLTFHGQYLRLRKYVEYAIRCPFLALNDPIQATSWSENLVMNVVNFSSTTEKTDEQIYIYIHNYLNQTLYTVVPPAKESLSRAGARLDEIRCICNSLNFIFSPSTVYVDIGCSHGSITSLIMKHFQLLPENVFGLDILPPSEVTPLNTFHYIQVPDNPSITQTIPIPSNSVHFMTALMSFHHMKEVNVPELARMMCPGGILILREHDVDGEIDLEDKITLDILHGLFCISWSLHGQQENPSFCQNFHANYHNRQQWTTLFSPYFELFDQSIPLHQELYEGIRVPRDYLQPPRPIRNAYRTYWAAYRRL